MKSSLRHCLVMMVYPCLLLYSGGNVWSVEPHIRTEISRGTVSLPSLVRQYLGADSDTQEELKERILARPDATLEQVTEIIQSGEDYANVSVGIFPGQRIRIKGQTYSYGLYVPQSYDPSVSFPLIICLHGAGFSGDSYLERWVPRLKQGYILACPTISRGAWWTRQGEDLVFATLHAVRARYHIDPDRVFLTGMSNGGIGAWIIGMHHAEVFAGVAPMASGIDEVLYPFLDNLKQTSVYVIHGAQDQVMPVWLSRKLVKEMKRRNISHVYREHNRSHPHAGGHFFPREELPGLIQWFDQQRRNPLPSKLTVVRDATHLESFLWVRIDATDRIAAFTDDLIDSQDEYIKKGIYARLQAEITEQNRIVVNTHRIRKFSLFLNKELVDLSAPVTVETNGRISFHGKVSPNLTTLLHQARLRQDPRLISPVQLVIDVTP
jgi:pimeloyl-ACP methyl ester carboxylesterase